MTTPGPYDFASDNAAGVDSRIFAALAEANAGPASPYGADRLSSEINTLYSQIFEREVFVFAVPTGTAANGLALGAVTPSYGAIFCHEGSHIVTTECGAPEFFSGGGRLILLPGANAKIAPETLAAALHPYKARNIHHLRPSALSLTQATERGGTYSIGELQTLSEIAASAGLKVHMDGARFANAMVGLGCTPAEMTWKAGIDVLSLGATKNGAMNVEAVVAFDPDTAETLRYLHKRAGFLLSKMRFASAQLRAYVTDDLWTDNARRANATARRLSAAIATCPGAALDSEVQANEIFVHFTPETVTALASVGIHLRPWAHPAGDMFRMVASFSDAEELIARFEAALAKSGQ